MINVGPLKDMSFRVHNSPRQGPMACDKDWRGLETLLQLTGCGHDLSIIFMANTAVVLA